MGIKPQIDQRKLKAELKAALDEVDKMVLKVLQRLGEECVRLVKDRPQEQSWFDQTGALRSSIGYVILKDGKQCRRGGFGRDEGGRKGISYAEELESRFDSGWALIIVAGMHYAVYVEAMEGKDVLASAELYAQKRLPEMMRKLAGILEKQGLLPSAQSEQG